MYIQFIEKFSLFHFLYKLSIKLWIGVGIIFGIKYIYIISIKSLPYLCYVNIYIYNMGLGGGVGGSSYFFVAQYTYSKRVG